MISLYTTEQGKVEALARGVKKITSKNSAALEPFFYVDVELLSGKDMFHIGSVQPLEAFARIRFDLTKIRLAGYSVALCHKLLSPGLADEHIFQLLLSWFSFLNESETQHILLLDSFVLHFFQLLGFDAVVAEVGGSEDVRKYLALLAGNSWQAINDAKIGLELAKKIHETVFRFATYHSEQQLVDWANLR